MASQAERFWVAFPHGSQVILARFERGRYDPHYSVPEQLRNASFLESMSITDALEMGATLTMAGTTAAGMLTNTLRQAKIIKATEDIKRQPLDPAQLANFAAQLDGIALDPTASVQDVVTELQRRQAPMIQQEADDDD